MPLHKEYQSSWTQAGYRSAMGSAAVVLPPDESFLRVYHITSAEFGISDISLGRIKVARFSDLNDPFELMAVNFREQRTRKIVRGFKDAYGATTGLLCFSADWTDPVLWSHYGDRHRGICLGFNVKKSLVQTVTYEDDRILAELPDDGEPSTLGEDLKNQLLCTKFRHWRYEEEKRIFIPLDKTEAVGNLNFYRFNDEFTLSEVILGPQCNLPLAQVRHLTEKLYQNVSVIKARLAFKFFKVVPQESTVL